MKAIWQEYGIEESVVNFAKFKPQSFLYTKIEEETPLQDDENDIDKSLALASFYFNENAMQKALKTLDKCVFISNSYHCYFHYFGFNLATKLWLLNGNEAYKKKADFLYPTGTFKEETIGEDFLPAYKDICIFKESTCFKAILQNDEKILEEAFTRSEKEHFNYHLVTADIFLLRALVWKALNKPEIANIDLEKALKMEGKNPRNPEISKLLKYDKYV